MRESFYFLSSQIPISNLLPKFFFDVSSEYDFAQITTISQEDVLN
jgi:hypothetical protein